VVKHAGDVVEILEAFDLTGSLREAARLNGCSPMTVARYVRLRERGQVAADPVRRDQILDPYLAKLEEWVERIALSPWSAVRSRAPSRHVGALVKLSGNPQLAGRDGYCLSRR
jgi:hypothetical protein